MQKLYTRWQLYCGRNSAAYWLTEIMGAALIFCVYMVYILVVLCVVFAVWLVVPLIGALYPYSSF